MIISTGKKLYDKNLTIGTSGNISIKTDKVILITKSGSSLGNLSTDDVVLIDFDGNETTKSKASSEKKLHVEIYKKRPDVKAIIHVHPVYLSSFAACNKALDEPILSESILYFHDIPVAPYYAPGTDELAQKTAEYFIDRDIVIMANHGVIAAADNIENAFNKVETAEYFAQVIINSKILGGAKPLNDNEISELLEIKSRILKNSGK